MIDVVETRDALDRAIADDRESAHLRVLLVGLRGEADTARTELEAVRRRHALEEEDVRRLEGVTLSALMAAVRGSRTGELDRERAEEVAARYALQTATARLAAVEARREEVDRRLARLGETADRRERAAQTHAEALRSTGGVPAPELEGVLDGLARVRAEATEVREALGAGHRAQALLDAARGHLGSAESWSTYDTWLGGGLLASSVKHDRIDSASDRMGEAQQALFDFARELADVEAVPTVRADLGISPTSRTVDVWLDNIFTDLSVGSRIKESLRDVDTALAAVRRGLEGLTLRTAALEQEEGALRERRDALLSPRG